MDIHSPMDFSTLISIAFQGMSARSVGISKRLLWIFIASDYHSRGFSILGYRQLWITINSIDFSTLISISLHMDSHVSAMDIHNIVRGNQKVINIHSYGSFD